MKFVNIGFGNIVAAERIIALVSPESAPVKRLVSEAREDGRVIDASCGRRTRTVIITDSEHVILSALLSETIAGRTGAAEKKQTGTQKDPAEQEKTDKLKNKSRKTGEKL